MIVHATPPPTLWGGGGGMHPPHPPRCLRPCLVWIKRMNKEWPTWDTDQTLFCIQTFQTSSLILNSYSYCPDTSRVFSFYNISQVGHPIIKYASYLCILIYQIEIHLPVPHKSGNLDVHPFLLFSPFFSPFFSLLPIFFSLHICIIMYPLRVIMLIKLCLLC